MDGFEDILYFVVLILFGVIGHFNKKKKDAQKKSQEQSKPQTNEHTHPSDEQAFGWDEFEEMLRGSRKVETETIINTPQASNAQIVEQRLRPSNSMRAQKFQKMQPSTFSQKFRHSSMMQNEQAQEEQDYGIGFEIAESFESLDEVKKAFVYSQVFERKY